MINHHFKAEHNAIVLLKALQRNPEMSTEGANLLIRMRGRSGGYPMAVEVRELLRDEWNSKEGVQLRRYLAKEKLS